MARFASVVRVVHLNEHSHANTPPRIATNVPPRRSRGGSCPGIANLSATGHASTQAVQKAHETDASHAFANAQTRATYPPRPAKGRKKARARGAARVAPNERTCRAFARLAQNGVGAVEVQRNERTRRQDRKVPRAPGRARARARAGCGFGAHRAEGSRGGKAASSAPVRGDACSACVFAAVTERRDGTGRETSWRRESGELGEWG